MSQYWWAAALGCSVLTSLYIYINQIFRLPGAMMMVYRGFGQVVMLLPFAFLFEPIDNWQFYALCTLQGFLIAFDDNRLLRSSKAFGAEITGAVQPLSLGLIFALWLVIRPQQFFELTADIRRFLLVVACLAGIAFSIMGLNKIKASRKAFQYLLPVLFALSLNDVVNKESMHFGAANLPSAIFYYILITAAVSGSANFYAFLRRHRPKDLVNGKNLRCGTVFVVLGALLIVVKNLAMYLTPNPAYASALIFLYPLWIIFANALYLRWKGCKDYPGVNFKIVAVLLTSVIGLVLVH